MICDGNEILVALALDIKISPVFGSVKMSKYGPSGSCFQVFCDSSSTEICDSSLITFPALKLSVCSPFRALQLSVPYYRFLFPP